MQFKYWMVQVGQTGLMPIETATGFEEHFQSTTSAPMRALGQCWWPKNGTFWCFFIKVRGKYENPFPYLETPAWVWECIATSLSMLPSIFFLFYIFYFTLEKLNLYKGETTKIPVTYPFNYSHSYFPSCAFGVTSNWKISVHKNI